MPTRVISLPSPGLRGSTLHVSPVARAQVSAGIPDFRTPGSGLYDNLSAYNLPYPEAIFDINYFPSNPAAFYRLCGELWPGTFAPTPAHRFVHMLHELGKLRRCYTQVSRAPKDRGRSPDDLPSRSLP